MSKKEIISDAELENISGGFSVEYKGKTISFDNTTKLKDIFDQYPEIRNLLMMACNVDEKIINIVTNLTISQAALMLKKSVSDIEKIIIQYTKEVES